MTALSHGPVEADMKRRAAEVRARLRDGAPKAGGPASAPPPAELLRALSAPKTRAHFVPPLDLLRALSDPATPQNVAAREAGEAALEANKRPTIHLIQKVTASFYGLRVADLISSRLQRDLIIARHVAMYLSKELTPQSYPAIGRYFGGRDHTTSLYACRKIERLVAAGDPVAADIAAIREALGCKA